MSFIDFYTTLFLMCICDFGNPGMGGGNWKPVPTEGGAGGDGAKLYIQAGSRMNDMPFGEDEEAPF